jgi:metal-responsive CopG/Arc/MetJ family transcriptional regulator
MLSGLADDIVNLSQKISGLKGVKFAKLVKAAVPVS